jgi:hypothetical protein
LSSHRDKAIPELIARFLAAHQGKNNSEVARETGIDNSIVARWRRGEVPDRMHETTRRRLEQLVGSAAAAHVSATAAESEIAKYALSTLRMIQRQAQAIADNAAEARRVLGDQTADARVAPGEGVTPSIEEVEVEAVVLQQQRAQRRGAPTSKRRA